MTGATGNGTDVINAVSINGVQNVNAYGTGDVGARINSAIAKLGAQGGTVYIPKGNYPFSTTIQCPIASDTVINIVGAGQSSDYNFSGTVLTYMGNGDAINQMVTPQPSGQPSHQNARGCQIRDLTLDGGSSCNNTASTNPACHTTGLHIGGTIYSRTENVLFRNFTDSCITMENVADASVGGQWTERYNFDKTSFSECGYGNVAAVASTHTYPNSTIYMHVNGGSDSFMHGAMNIHVGLFGNQNGIVIDNNAQATGANFDINGNMAPDSTGSLYLLKNGSYFFGKLTELPECMNNTGPTYCTRFNVDATSHVSVQRLGGIPGQYTDHLPFGADLKQVYLDDRVISHMVASCIGTYGLTPSGSGEMFNLAPGWGSQTAGLLAIASSYSGNATTTLFNLAAVSCNQGGTVAAGGTGSSLSVAKSTVYASGAPFTVTETCHSAAVIGSGTSTNPQYPAGSTTYNIQNNSPQNSFVTFTYLSVLNSYAGPGGQMYPATTSSGTYQSEECM